MSEDNRVLETFAWKSQSYTSRDIGLIAGLASVTLVYGYFSSVSLRGVTRSTDVFFLMATVFTVLKCLTPKAWGATLLALVSSPVYLLTGAPLAVHIPIALTVNGFIFDVYLSLGKEGPRYTRRQLVVAGALGSFVMAAITFSVFRAFGPAVGIVLPAIVYPLGLVTDTIVGAVGVVFGVFIARRLGAEYSPLKTIRMKTKLPAGIS